MALFNDVHHISGDNLKLIYDFKSEKFYQYIDKNRDQNQFTILFDSR